MKGGAITLGKETGAGAPWRVHLGLVFVQLTFGGFHVVSKAMLTELHPLALAGLRVMVAAPVLLALAWALDRTWPRWRDLPRLALLGLLGVFTNQLLYILGLNYTTATNAAILMPSIPVFALAVALVLRVEKPSLRRFAGIALAVAGALVMLEPTRFRLGDATLQGNIMILANCFSFAAFLVFMRPVLRRLPVTTVIAWSFLFGGLGLSAVSWPYVADMGPSTLSTGVWVGLAYIILIPTILNYIINTWAVARSTPSLVATYTTLQPLSSGTLAWLFLSESLAWPQLVGGVFIVAGLYVISWRRRPA